MAKDKGVYLWTILFKDKYLTYYVGETGKSFIFLHNQHLDCYLTGFYRVYDPKESPIKQTPYPITLLRFSPNNVIIYGTFAA